MGDELWRRGALELAGMIARREVSSVEVVQVHLDRIDDVNGKLNAVVRRMDADALTAAREADAAVAAGAALGPFHGVPMTVKENIDLAGTPTTSALVAMAEAVVPVDAPIVERMKAAGAIPIGRTNLPDMGLRVTTESSLHGVTHNPWNVERTAGGSSGGEASALAAGMSPIGLGNDIGGSLRNPAHCCGITSIKPSTGVIPSAGVLPPDEQTISFQLMAVQGVMARRVADVRAGLLAVAGPHERDPLALPVQLADLDPSRPLRVALVPEPPGGDTDPGIAGAIRGAGEALARLGAVVEEVAPATYERAIQLWGQLLGTEITLMRPLLDAVMGDGGKQFLDHTMHVIPPVDLVGFSQVLMGRNGAEKDFHEFLGRHDVIVSPTWALPAFPIGSDAATREGTARTFETIRPVLPANLLGLPAAVVPVGVVDGLPVGAQVIARRFADLRCLTVAQMLEDALGTITPIDPTW
jgi:amidase